MAAPRRLVYEPEAGTYPFASATVPTDPFGRKVRCPACGFGPSRSAATCSTRSSTASMRYSSHRTSYSGGCFRSDPRTGVTGPPPPLRPVLPGSLAGSDRPPRCSARGYLLRGTRLGRFKEPEGRAHVRSEPGGGGSGRRRAAPRAERTGRYVGTTAHGGRWTLAAPRLRGGPHGCKTIRRPRAEPPRRRFSALTSVRIPTFRARTRSSEAREVRSRTLFSCSPTSCFVRSFSCLFSARGEMLRLYRGTPQRFRFAPRDQPRVCDRAPTSAGTFPCITRSSSGRG